MKYARVQNGVAVEILQPVEGFLFTECFHPDIVKQCIPCDDEVKANWLLQEDNSFVAPPEEPAQ